MNGNSTTVKWIGLIIGIIIALGGWFFAGTQLSASSRLAAIEADALYMKTIVDRVNENQIRLMEQLSFLRGDIQDLKDEIKKYNGKNN